MSRNPDTRTRSIERPPGVESGPGLLVQVSVSQIATFGTMAVTLHDPIAPSGAQQVMEWVRTHFESVSGRAGYADFYKRDIQLKLLDPVGTGVVELLKRA